MCVLEIQKFLRERVFDEIPRDVLVFRGSALFKPSPFNVRCASTFEEKRADLPFEHVRRPNTRDAFGFVKISRRVGFDFQKQAIMHPAKNSTRCMEFFGVS
jgi:hypothetical protein